MHSPQEMHVGIAHRRIQVKSNARGVTFAHASENKIVFDFVAAADAAVAKNAGIVVYGDGQGRIVFAARDGAAGETRGGISAAFACASSSQSPECCCLAQGDG